MKTNFTDKIEVGNDICSLGHIGALCETCDLYNIRGNGTYAVTGIFFFFKNKNIDNKFSYRQS
jgi:hypothetical protein